MPTSAVASAKAEMFKSLAHPLRIRVLELLVSGERPVGALAAALDAETSHLSQQLAVLRRGQLVQARRVGSTVFYSVRDPRVADLLAVAREMLLGGLRDSQVLLTDLEEERSPQPAGRSGS